MEKIKTALEKFSSELKLIKTDLANKQITPRVRYLFASICCVILVVSACICIHINRNQNAQSIESNNGTVSEESTGEVSGSTEAADSENAATDKEDSSETSETEVVIPSALLAPTDDAGEAYIAETLFMGDSNTVRMMNYGITSLDNTIAVVGMGIQSVKTLQCVQFSGYDEPITMVEAVKLFKPRRIIITFGTNNANGMTVSDFIVKYKEALAAVSEASPKTDILINSIPPICKENKYPTLSQASIDEFNEALLTMAEELGYGFLDTASVMKDEKTGYAKAGFTISDGIHISDEGFAAMFTYIRTHAHVAEGGFVAKAQSTPKQEKATYVIDSSGKMNNDPAAYKEMSEVSNAQKEALKKAQEEALKKALEEIKNDASTCKHTSVSSSIVKEATESSTGTLRYTCNSCGYTYDETIPRKQHTHYYSWVTVMEPSVNQQGLRQHRCSCGEYDAEEYIPALQQTSAPTEQPQQTPQAPQSPQEQPGTSSSATEQPSYSDNNTSENQNNSGGDGGQSSGDGGTASSEQSGEPGQTTEEPQTETPSGGDGDGSSIGDSNAGGSSEPAPVAEPTPEE